MIVLRACVLALAIFVAGQPALPPKVNAEPDGSTAMVSSGQDPGLVSATAVYWINGRVIYVTISVPWEVYPLIDDRTPMQVVIRTSPGLPRAIITQRDSSPYWVWTVMMDDPRLPEGAVRFTVDAPDFAVIGGYRVAAEEHCWTQSASADGWSDGFLDWTVILP
jgi:hypothetical protein